MRLSKACGFDTADCDIVTFDGEPFYVTVRYDREERDGVVTRLHQEDFCQLLRCRPEIKYQDQGGPSIAECAKLLLSMRLPLSDVISFVDRCVFNFIVGNGDAHGKNFSILYQSGTPRLAPVYDVICTTVYPAIAKKMAMKFDGKFEFRWVTPGKIVRTFGRAGIGEKVVTDAIARQCASVRTQLPSLVDEANISHPSPIYHDIVQGIHRRIQQLA
jgi:serine/threonine-protein kinase HipA